MDDRNLELEAWLIEAAGEEMMANHLGPNWNKFNDEFGFYPNMGMTVADLVWQHQQAKVESLKGQLIKLGFTDHGGLLMKPPVGKTPRFDLLDELRNALKNLVQKYKSDAHDLNLIGDQDKARVYNGIANQLDHLLKDGA
ncbi:hypothetical protein NQ805_15435 [Acinetobacter baumannii]|nr:hypothetical protein [Acinetobacter baumannii]